MFVNDQSTENVCFCMKMQYIQLVFRGDRDGGPQVRDSDPGEGVALRGEVRTCYAYYIHRHELAMAVSSLRIFLLVLILLGRSLWVEGEQYIISDSPRSIISASLSYS